MNKQKTNGKNILGFISLLDKWQVHSQFVEKWDFLYINNISFAVETVFGIDEKTATSIIKQYVKIHSDYNKIVGIPKNKRTAKQTLRLRKGARLIIEFDKASDEIVLKLKPLLTPAKHKRPDLIIIDEIGDIGDIAEVTAAHKWHSEKDNTLHFFCVKKIPTIPFYPYKITNIIAQITKIDMYLYGWVVYGVNNKALLKGEEKTLLLAKKKVKEIIS